MEITNNYAKQAFGARFERKAFAEVVDYAAKTRQLNKLDSALNSLLHVNTNKGDILVVHGKNKDGQIFSSFTLGKKSVQNSAINCKTPAEASFKGIIKLGEFGHKYRRLFGNAPKSDLKPEDIMTRYSK